ncbi:MAG: ABC transporter ATP-binding protein [Alphaproteobacteria bacterium]|nr:ABC transporter ATP-binding protein [Alphaproteobacteria bacterium]
MAFIKKSKDLPKLTKENMLMYKRVWNTYVADKWRWLVLAVFLMLIAASFDALLVRQLKPIFDEVFIDKNKDSLGVIGLTILGLYFLKGVFTYTQVLVMTKLSIRVIADMQRDIFKRLIRMDNAFFQAHTTGEIITRFTSDVAMVKDAVLNSLTTFVKDTASVVFLVVLMFFQSLEMACVVFFVFPLGVYPVVLCGRKMRKKTKRNQEANEGFFNQLTQSFKGIKIVKSYCMENREFNELNNTIVKMNKLAFSMACLHALQSPLMEFFGGIAMATTLGYGGYQIMQGNMSPGNFMVFLLAIVAAYKPMKNVAGLHMRMQMGVASMQRLFSMLDIEPVIKDAPNAKDLVVSEGKIEVENVSFSYDGEHPVLTDVSLKAEPGQTIALVGHSGSGKSTLINFLPRFYDPQKGRILIDGQDISQVTLESLRKHTAYVSQDVILFNDTIKNNIRYGSPDATDEQVVEAAKAAAADKFISQMEDGYDTLLGEQGSGLSGGQRQMISIARAMLKNAPILLLDEATSALDSQSEKIVQDSLEILMKGRTSVVIAHRLSTVVNADRIYVFNEGKIVDSGTHKELLTRDGIYAQLYKIQFMKEGR